MGYKTGFGLGKNGQGIKNPINIPIKTNHFGLGLEVEKSKLSWKYEVDHFH